MLGTAVALGGTSYERSPSDSRSPPPRLPQSNFYGGTYMNNSNNLRDESPLNGESSPSVSGMMRTKENENKLRIVNSNKRLPKIENPYES